MSLEDALKENTATMKDLIAALGSTGAASGKAAEKPAGKPAGKAKPAEEPTSKYSADDVKTIAVKVKDTLGTKVAKDLIKSHGADSLTDLKPAVFEDFVAAAEALLNPGEKDDDL